IRGLPVLGATRLAAIRGELCLVHTAMSPSLTSYRFSQSFTVRKRSLSCTRERCVACVRVYAKPTAFLTTSLANRRLEITGEGRSHLGTRRVAPLSKSGLAYRNFVIIWKNSVIEQRV